MVRIKDIDKLGSTDLVSWIRESTLRIEKDFKNWFDEDTSVFHIYPTHLDGFKASVEQYAKEHPDMDIRASGFLISTKPKVKKD